MSKYLCDDGNAEIEIEASCAGEAAQEYVDGGDWGDGSETIWVNVYVQEVDEDGEEIGERDSITITIDATEPDCQDGEDHDWRSPYGVLGGVKENPGVWGHGGGVVIKEVCAHCGRYRVTDTWAQNPETGEQGLDSVEYRDADDDSIAYVARRLRSATLEIDLPDGYTADDSDHDGPLYLVRDDDDKRVRVTRDEQRAVIESGSWDDIIEQMPGIEEED